MWQVNAYMKGATVDLTPYVTNVSVQFGGTLKNQAGALLPPATGAITLNNNSGDFKQFSPASNIDTDPGPPVEVLFDNKVIFTGYSGGIRQAAIGSTNDRIATMVLIGPLARLFGYHEQLFLDLSGTIRADVLVGRMLTNVGWGTDDCPDFPVVGGREIAVSRTLLYAFGLEQAGITFSGRRRVRLQDALGALALLEFGRIYDNEKGHVVFDDRDTTFARRLNRTPVALSNRATRLMTTDPTDGVVNVVSTTTSSFEEGGNGDVPVLQFNRSVSLPITVSVEANETYTLAFDLDLDEWDFVAWDALVKDTHYTSDIIRAPSVSTTERSITIGVTNPGAEAMDFTLEELTGSRFKAIGTRVATARNASSIARFGEREISVNTIPYVDTASHRDFANFIVNAMGNAAPFIKASYIFDAAVPMSMGSVVSLTESEFGLSSEPCNVEAIRYESVDGHAERIAVHLDMSLNRTLGMWLLGSHAWAGAGRVGF